MEDVKKFLADPDAYAAANPVAAAPAAGGAAEAKKEEKKATETCWNHRGESWVKCGKFANFVDTPPKFNIAPGNRPGHPKRKIYSLQPIFQGLYMLNGPRVSVFHGSLYFSIFWLQPVRSQNER